jgi:gliding motility-associated-like protein
MLMPIQYGCKSDTVWKDNFQTIFPPVALFEVPLAVCDSATIITIRDRSKKARSYKWNFGREDQSGERYQLIVDTIGSGDNATEREWLWSSSSNDPDSLNYLEQWRTEVGDTAAAGWTVTRTQINGIHYLRESHDGSITSPHYKFKDFGRYSIALRTFNDTVKGKHTSEDYTDIPDDCAGCGDDWIQHIVLTKVTPDIVQQPSNLSIADMQLCQLNDVLILKDLSTTALDGTQSVSRIWDFGDGSKPITTTKDTVHHIYSTPQANPGYTLKITTIDKYGCKDSVQQEISIMENPEALFALAARDCANRGILFEDNSTAAAPASLKTWQWVFEAGDSLTIHDNFNGTYKWEASNNQLLVNDTTAKNPTHIFTTTGNKKPQLKVTDTHGCYHTVSMPTALSSVTANVELRDTVLPLGADYCHDGTIRLYNSSKTSQYSIQSTWDLGDGTGEQSPLTNANIASQVPAVFSYADKLNITKDTTIVIRLAVTERPTNVNAPGCTDTIRKTIHISRPVSRFSADNRAKDCPPLDVVFSAASSTTTIVSWDWSFGDNTINSLLAAPQHTYEMPGKFAVGLTVTDEFGCKDTRIEDPFISVGGPTGTAIVSNASVCVPFPIDFSSKDVTNAVSARWIFDDGNAQAIPIHDTTIAYTYTNGYTFYPLLELIDAKGCRVNIKANSIEAREVVPNFTMLDSIVCSQAQIKLVDISTSSHPLTAWRWTVENMTTGVKTNSTEQYPTITVPYGMYKVSLEALIGGCGAEVIRDSAVQVYAMPTAAFTTMKDTVNMFEELWFTNTSTPAPDSKFSTFYIWDFGDNTPEQTAENTKHVFSRSGSFDVLLSAFEHKNCPDVASKTIFVRNQKGIPNVFTPNGDGINDVYLKDMGFKNIIILNRWGQTMYEGTEGWDGLVYGVEATPGTYFYIVTTVTGEVLKGALTLLRN